MSIKEHFPSSITCKSCRATLDIQNMKDYVQCPYCGSTYAISDILNESDTVRSERIKVQAEKELEEIRMKNDAERAKQDEVKDSIEKFKKGKFSKFLLICTILCGLIAAFELSGEVSLSGLIAAVQAVLFLTAWLMGRGIVPSKKNLHTLLATIALILAIPFLIFFGNTPKKSKEYKPTISAQSKESEGEELTILETSAPTSEAESEESEFSETEEVTEETKGEEQTTSATQPATEMRAEFKEAMDSYEKFMNEYCDFMEKYIASGGTDLPLLQEYAEYMSKYNEVSASFKKWDSSDLNEAESEYYIEVQTRINERLVKIGQ